MASRGELAREPRAAHHRRRPGAAREAIVAGGRHAAATVAVVAGRQPAAVPRVARRPACGGALRRASLTEEDFNYDPCDFDTLTAH